MSAVLRRGVVEDDQLVRGDPGEHEDRQLHSERPLCRTRAICGSRAARHPVILTTRLHTDELRRCAYPPLRPYRCQLLQFGSDTFAGNDPEHQEKLVKLNEYLFYNTTLDLTAVVNDLAAEGTRAAREDLATVSPYITSKTRRFGQWALDLTPPPATQPVVVEPDAKLRQGTRPGGPDRALRDSGGAGQLVGAEAACAADPGLGDHGGLPRPGRSGARLRLQRPNDWGLGFELRVHKSPHWAGSRSSPGTFGHFGQSGTFLWVDPVAGAACIALTTRDFDHVPAAPGPRSPTGCSLSCCDAFWMQNALNRVRFTAFCIQNAVSGSLRLELASPARPIAMRG